MRISKLFKSVTPPDSWRIPVIIISGIIIGLIAYALYLSKAHSYLSDSPKTCVNCHVMAPQYATWNHSAHREVATCNDCHIPHDNWARHWMFKAQDGLRHATVFTLRNEPQVIYIKEEGAKVVQENCIRCHNELFESNRKMIGHSSEAKDRQCWECHRETPHGRVNSLSSVPNARVPLPESPVPDWIRNLSK